MTHNIIHDEEKIGEIINDIPYELVSEMKYGDDNMIIESMKQYAEHYLIKHIDSEIERKKVQRQNKRCGACDGAKVGHAMFCTIIDEDEKYLQSLKAELQNNG